MGIFGSKSWFVGMIFWDVSVSGSGFRLNFMFAFFGDWVRFQVPSQGNYFCFLVLFTKGVTFGESRAFARTSIHQNDTQGSFNQGVDNLHDDRGLFLCCWNASWNHCAFVCSQVLRLFWSLKNLDFLFLLFLNFERSNSFCGHDPGPGRESCCSQTTAVWSSRLNLIYLVFQAIAAATFCKSSFVEKVYISKCVHFWLAAKNNNPEDFINVHESWCLSLENEQPCFHWLLNSEVGNCFLF